MRVTVLGSGTSTGVPEIGCTCEVCTSKDKKDNRLRASVVVQTDNSNILIDCGPDFRTQMLNTGIVSLTGLLVTHTHYDHIGGMDDLRPFCRHGAFSVYGERRVCETLMDKYSYMFQDHKYPGVPNIDLITIHRTPFEINNDIIIPIRLFHYKLPVLGYRIKNFAYLTDFSFINDEELDKLRELDCLIIDALRKKQHMSHLSLDEALQLIKKINPKRAYLTHMSHQMGLHETVSNELPENVFLCYDGMTINV
ncbi:MAG: MBL fold metallo-hydrolase [Bacteroidales bacterium]|nr:MBL fold metallo-hydrolase [Bacteroidales bacterium]